jgi:hypothetical protein
VVTVKISVMGQIDRGWLNLHNDVLERASQRRFGNAIKPGRGKVEKKHALCAEHSVGFGRLLPPLLYKLGRKDVWRTFANDDHVHVITYGHMASDHPAASQHLVVWMGSDN